MNCVASWLLELHDDEPWPMGKWQHCASPVTALRIVRITDDVMIRLPMCAAHVSLLDAVLEEDDKTLEFVKLEVG